MLINSSSPYSNFENLFKAISDSAFVKVHECYHFRAHSEWTFRKKSYDDFHMILIKSGKAVYKFGGAKEVVTDGQIVLMSENLVFDGDRDVDNPPFVVPVRFGLYDKATGSRIKPPYEPWYMVFKAARSTELQLLFEKLFYYRFEEQTDIYEKLCTNVLYEILALLYLQINQEAVDSKIDKRIQRAKLMIESEPFRRFTTEELSSSVGLSSKQFRALFKKYYKLTAKDYQLRIRMRYAVFFLNDNKYSLSTIASMLGYPDQFTFSKQFKRILGYSPSDIMRKSLTKPE